MSSDDEALRETLTAARPHIRQFGRADVDHMFRAAVRHSRHVRILRLAIPAGIGLALAGSVAFWALLKPLKVPAKLPVEVGSTVVSAARA